MTLCNYITIVSLHYLKNKCSCQSEMLVNCSKNFSHFQKNMAAKHGIPKGYYM